MPKPEMHAIETIRTHDSYHGWPTVTRLQNGELWVVVSAGRERHVCPFGQVHLLRSQDDGRTWSAPTVLANGPLDDRDAGILQTSRGTVLVNWFTSVAWLHRLERAEAEDPDKVTAMGDGFVARCHKVRALLANEVIRRELGTWILRSEDNGKTWSEKIDCGVGSPHGPTELADGRILFIGNRKYDASAAGGARPMGRNGSPYSSTLGAAVSGDDGRTWRALGDIPLRPGDEPGNYVEPHAVQAPDGRILVHIRNHSERDSGQILQSESIDGGESFSVPRDTALTGLPAHLLRLRDGRLLSTYGYRITPFGNRASLSEDGGRSWSEPMILDEKPVQRDLGYPSTTELADGSLISVWYEKLPDESLATVQVARWSLK